jgi:hypothetical protein
MPELMLLIRRQCFDTGNEPAPSDHGIMLEGGHGSGGLD